MLCVRELIAGTCAILFAALNDVSYLKMRLTSTYDVLDAVLLFLERLLKRFRLAELSARIYEHQPSVISLDKTAAENWRSGAPNDTQEKSVCKAKHGHQDSQNRTVASLASMFMLIRSTSSIYRLRGKCTCTRSVRNLLSRPVTQDAVK